MNQIANRAAAGALAALSNLKSGLQNVASTIVTPGGMPIMRLLKDGTWVYGAENVEVETGALWAVNVYSLQHGWVAWTDKPGNQTNEIVGEVMVPMTSPLPAPTELRDVGCDWKQQLSIELLCLNGADQGEVAVYKVTSVGGMNAVKTLVAAIMKQLDVDADRPVPVVSLQVDHYMHKKYGKTYVPVIQVEKWVELTEEAPEVGEPEPKAQPAAQERPSRQRQPAQAAQPAAEEPKAATVQVTDADRRAALLAELNALDKAGAEEAAVDNAVAEDAPRRRRRA